MVFTVGKIDHIVLNSLDIGKSLHFYIDILGCELVRKVETPPLYQLRAGESMIDLKPAQYRDEHVNMDHFCFQISPFEPERLIPYLEAKGVPCGSVEQRNGALGFGDSIYIEDPDGNRIELKTS